MGHVLKASRPRGITILQRGKTAFVDPSQIPELQGFADTLIIEVVKPYEWQRRAEWKNGRFPPLAYPSKGTMEAVRKEME